MPYSDHKTAVSYSDIYPHVQLDDDEIAQAMAQARKAKHFRMKEAEYRRKLSEQFKPKNHTWKELFDVYGLEWDIDSDNEMIVRSLCMYFTRDENFPGDLNKGILLHGPVGVGKSAMMKFFKRNQTFAFRVVACRDISNSFAAHGYDCIETYSSNHKLPINEDKYGMQEIGMCFDDLGTEPEAKHFGADKNMMAEIILNRYDRGLPFISTHATMNITIEQLEQNYGSRVRDRLREMFNLIKFGKDAKTRRK